MQTLSIAVCPKLALTLRPEESEEEPMIQTRNDGIEGVGGARSSRPSGYSRAVINSVWRMYWSLRSAYRKRFLAQKLLRESEVTLTTVLW